jgi:TrmH RNA methyltransferase
MTKLKKNLEMRIYGRHACLKLLIHRPEDMIRAYVTQDGLFEFRPIIRYCSDHKLAYHVVEKEELDSITKATHHEGICLVIKTKKAPTLKELFSQKGRNLILALEEVENPHNLGAIMRTSAHFGVSGIIYEAKVPVALSAAAYRTAEGGAETVATLQISDWNEVFEEAKRSDYKIFGTSGHEGESLFSLAFPEKTIVFLGAEGKGLSSKMLKKMSRLITIPGTGAVESLNVSNANTSILTEWFRQGVSK